MHAPRESVTVVMRCAPWRDRPAVMLPVMVHADGTASCWDDIAGCYTRRHDLTPRQIAAARELARRQGR